MEKEVRKKRPRLGGKLLLFVCAAALFGGLGLGAGLGFGGGGFTGSPSSGQAGEETRGAKGTADLAAPEITPDLSTYFVVEVNEEEIVFRGQTHSLASLRDALLEAYNEGEVYELWDNHAIKADYDAVKALLEELFIEYIEK
jgi:hypothetical protein